jgi:hypothetical protein
VAIRGGWTGDADDRKLRGSTRRPGRPHGFSVGRKAGTVRAAIDGVAQTYQANKLNSPAHDSQARLEPVLAAQLRGYSLADPETSQQQALPAAVVEVIANARATESHRAIGQLMVGDFFFAMRSCEYSEASGSRRTKTVRIGDIVFRLGGEPIRSVDEGVLVSADTVSVTYRTQENGKRGVTVMQHRTSAKPGTGRSLSALRSCRIGIAQHIGVQTRHVPVGGRGGPTYEPCSDGRNRDASDGDHGRGSASAPESSSHSVWGGTTGLSGQLHGTHSLRAGAAMAMFLAGVPVETIQDTGPTDDDERRGRRHDRKP